jgi:Do/DeqQ family serine protease
MNGKRITTALLLSLVSLLSLQAQEWRTTVENLQTAFREVSKQVLPVVVEIEVVEVIQLSGGSAPRGFFFWPFGGNNEETAPREYRQSGLGSGVLVERRGETVYVLTNNHVVGTAEEINIKLYDGREFKGRLVGGDPLKDLALVAFDTRDEIPLARLGDSDRMQVGDWVLAIGNPYGFESTVTAGIISAVGRKGLPGSQTITDYFQTDAAINQGNSGGALVNLRGEVIGINTWIASQSGGSVGLGFAIPINNARQAISDFITRGSVQYGWLGVTLTDLNNDIRKELELPENIDGALITNIFIPSPALDGEIRPGDLVVKVNDKPVRNSDDMTRAVTGLRPGEKISIQVIRKSKVENLTVTIGLRETESRKEKPRLWPGLTVIPLSDDIRRQLNIPKNSGQFVIAGVDDSSSGLRNGDVIKTVNKKNLKNLREFYDMVNKSDSLTFKILRQGYEMDLEIKR